MVVVSKLCHMEFGPNDHQEDAPHFMKNWRCPKLNLNYFRKFSDFNDRMLVTVINATHFDQLEIMRAETLEYDEQIYEEVPGFESLRKIST